jgi:hypothetical protein
MAKKSAVPEKPRKAGEHGTGIPVDSSKIRTVSAETQLRQQKCRRVGFPFGLEGTGT